MSETPASPNRLRALDVLRCAAIGLVLLRHCPPHERLSGFGWIGVDLFFVLSGFLVSGLLFSNRRRHHSLRITRFFIRRGFKIYPAFYLFIAVTLLVAGLTGERAPLRRVAAEVLFVQNYFPGVWDHTWSLAVEEHFYLLLPFLLALLLRRERWLPPILLGICAAVLGGRCLTALLRPLNYYTLLFPTHLRLDGLLFGVWLAWFWHHQHERFVMIVRRHRALLLLTAAGGVLPALVLTVETDRLMNTLGFTLLYLGFGALLAVMVTAEGKWQRHPVAAAAAAIGEYSYSIYLWHVAVLRWLPWPEWIAAPWLRCLGYLPVAVVFGMLMARLIERPSLILRDRLFPETTRAL